MFQHDLTNTGANPSGTGPQTEAGTAWSADSGGQFTSPPILGAETVYVADSDEEAVRAYDRASGTEQWSQGIDVFGSRMHLEGGILYVPGPRLQALDAASGQVLWSVGLGGRAYDVKVRDTIAFVAGQFGMSAVKVNNQTVLWNRSDVRTVDAGAAVEGSTLWVPSTSNGVVRALGVGDGGQRWVRFLETQIRGTPTVAGTNLVVPGNSELIALDASTGNDAWTYEAPVRGSVVAANGTVYGVTSNDEMIAVDLASGSEQWRTSTVASRNHPVLAGGLLYVAGNDGTVSAVNPDDGAVVWQMSVDEPLSVGPAVAGGELYVTGDDGGVYALSSEARTATPTASPTATASSTATQTGTPTKTAEVDTTAPPTAGGTDAADGEDKDEDGGGGGLPLGLIGLLVVILGAGGAAALVGLDTIKESLGLDGGSEPKQ